MSNKRIIQHPVLTIPERTEVPFTWNGQSLNGYEGEMISSALIAHDIQVFGHHPKDHSPQGIYCANGQCSQCLVIADGLPVKSCMTPLKPGMQIQSVEGLPRLPADDRLEPMREVPIREVEVLILGGGPAGISAAIELGKRGIDTLIVDDKDMLGGKLVLQTHKFFGSVEDSHAGTRGFEIARILEKIYVNWFRLRFGSTARPWPCSRTGWSVLSKTKFTAGSNRKNYWWRRAPGKKCFLSRVILCPAFTAPAPSRPWSTAI